jgi:hypothetical protein
LGWYELCFYRVEFYNQTLLIASGIVENSILSSPKLFAEEGKFRLFEAAPVSITDKRFFFTIIREIGIEKFSEEINIIMTDFVDRYNKLEGSDNKCWCLNIVVFDSLLDPNLYQKGIELIDEELPTFNERNRRISEVMDYVFSEFSSRLSEMFDQVKLGF